MSSDRNASVKPRVLFFSTIVSTFVVKDQQILEKFATVKIITGGGLWKLLMLIFQIFSCEVVFCWFGTVYSSIAVFFAKLFHKKAIIVLGGFDVSRMPEFEYGVWVKVWKSKLLRQGFRKADYLLAVSPSFKEKVQTLAGYDADNVRYLPTGFDSDFWKPDGRKEKMILCVAHTLPSFTRSDAKKRFKIKGIDFLFSAAGKISETRFVLIGFGKDFLAVLSVDCPPNVTILPFMEKSDLLGYYQRASVYCQPSRSEGISNSLCEAMLCGCVPVATHVGGMPTAVGDTGYTVAVDDLDGLVLALSNALKAEPKQGMKARERIKREFSLSRREQGLKEIIEKV